MMYCFVKDGKSFATIAEGPAYEYYVVFDSIYDELSRIRIPHAQQVKEGDIIYTDLGYCGVIDSVTTQKNEMELNCSSIATLFERKMVYNGERCSGGIESYLRSLIEHHYKNQSDKEYRIPYLDVVAVSTTHSTLAPDVDEQMWNIKSFVSKIRRVLNVFLRFSVTRKTLKIEIFRKNATVKKIDFSDTEYKIEEETFSQSSVAKITAYANDTGLKKHYYLLKNGGITSVDMDGRAFGQWIYIAVEREEDMHDQVVSEFRKNSYSHKILFTAPKQKARYEFYDDVLLNINGNIFRSYIASVSEEKKNNRIRYQCGELRTTATDNLKEIM